MSRSSNRWSSILSKKMNTLADAKIQAWDHRHWSRPLFPAFPYHKDEFVDSDVVSETVGFLKAAAMYENDPEFLYRHLLVLYAIRNQPWNFGYASDISERYDEFQEEQEANPTGQQQQQEIVRNLVNSFMNYYQGEMQEDEENPVHDDFAASIFAKNWPDEEN